MQGLAITTFELTTLGYIFCTVGTHLCWLHKPADVEVPVHLSCEVPLRQILVDAGAVADDSYSWTPLEFVSREEWSFSIWWSFVLNLFRTWHVHFRSRVRPITRIPNDNFPIIPPVSILCLGLVDIAYVGIYLCGWNFWFPTRVEQIAWRTCTLVTLGCVVVYLTTEAGVYLIRRLFPERVPSAIDNKERMVRTASKTSRIDRHPWTRNLHDFLDWLRNNSPNKDPKLYMPLKALLPVTFAAFIYCWARLYILLELWVNLRAQPASTYATVNWWSFLPHV